MEGKKRRLTDSARQDWLQSRLRETSAELDRIATAPRGVEVQKNPVAVRTIATVGEGSRSREDSPTTLPGPSAPTPGKQSYGTSE